MRHPFTRLPAVMCAVSAALGSLAQGGPIHSSVSWQEVELTTPATIQPYMRSVAVADLDKDGFLDVVAASQNPSIVAWYCNNGDATFSLRNVISTALQSPTGIVAADLDADGRIDIVCSSQDDSRITWFKNVANAGGSPNVLFPAQPAVSTTADRTQAIAVAALNADVAPDILIATYNFTDVAGLSRVAWFRNLSPQPGQFGVQEIISNVDLAPLHLSAADLNGDLIPDLVVSGSANTVAWFRGSRDSNGNPQFTRFVVGTNQQNPVHTFVADLDGDGRPDILSASAFGDTLRWFRNLTNAPSPVAPFFAPGQTITNVADGVYCVVAADLNTDGRPDAISASVFDNTIAWYENLGNGNFGWSAATPNANVKNISTTADGAITVATGDFNQDGMMDVVAGSDGDGKVAVHFHQGGQSALATTDTAPAVLTEGRSGAFLRIVASNRGIAGDNEAQLFSVALFLETSPGVVMTTAQANLLMDRIEIYRDTNNSNAFEPATDTLVGTATELALTNGLLTVPVAPADPADARIAPGESRSYFVVAKLGGTASAQIPATMRVTHRSKGSGRTVLKDATTGAALTIELAGNTIISSGLVTAQPPHTYTDFSAIYFGDSSAPGAGPLIDFDFDGTLNLLEFAFGTDPIIPSATMIVSGVVPGSTLIRPGLPTIAATGAGTGVEFQALFCRRKDPLSGLTYTVQFASDLSANTVWENSLATPTVIADDGVIQAMSVPYPLLLPNLQKPRFFRVAVTSQ